MNTITIDWDTFNWLLDLAADGVIPVGFDNTVIVVVDNTNETKED